jgi:hypothetical protein
MGTTSLTKLVVGVVGIEAVAELSAMFSFGAARIVEQSINDDVSSQRPTCIDGSKRIVLNGLIQKAIFNPALSDVIRRGI